MEEDEQKRQAYIEEVYCKDGIQLEYHKVTKNPGLRALAKLMLNSFWGKFGQSTNKSRVEAITAPSKFFKLLLDESLQIQSVRVVNEEMIEVVSKKIKEEEEINPSTNVFIAAFTTCWARLRLYEAMESLEACQIMYLDTDSLIYNWKPGQPEIPLGCRLGEFSDELKGDVITEFCAAGPKNYGYKTSKMKQECKVRGFSLTVRASKNLNFETMRENIMQEVATPQESSRCIDVVYPHKIVRDSKSKTLYAREETKKYSLVADKRVIDKDSFLSYPYGYEKKAHSSN